jgi:hypothetical protein
MRWRLYTRPALPAGVDRLATREARVGVGGRATSTCTPASGSTWMSTGSGDVRYHGDTALTQHVDGSGELSRVD